MLSTNPHRLSFQEIQLLKVVAKRVADKPLEAVVNGPACTDGKTICLPIEPPQFSLHELIGITSHESSHIRFHTIFGSNIDTRMCPENPSLGRAVLNILEDARVDSLLKEAYLGFWIELDHANRRQALRSVEEMRVLPDEILHSNSTASFLLRLMNLDLTGNISLLLTDNLRLPSGCFKFAAKALAKFWDVFLNAKQYLYKYRTFPGTVIAGRRVIKAIQRLLAESQKERESEGGANDQEQQSDQEEDKEGSSSSPQNQNNGECSLENQELGESQENECTEEDMDSGAGGEMFPEDPEFDPESEETPPDLEHQILKYDNEGKPVPKHPSGIDFKELEGEEREILEELERILQDPHADDNKLPDSLQEKMELARKDMQDILDHIKQEEASNPPNDQVEKCHEDGHDIAIHVYDTAAILKQVNQVSNPEERYARMLSIV